MKNALKFVYGMLDLVKNREIGTIFRKKGQLLKKCKNEDHTLSLTLCQSVRECPNFLKIYPVTNFDMDFEKKLVSGRSECLDFFYRRVSREPPLKSSLNLAI
jgi:hypothetical protein